MALYQCGPKRCTLSLKVSDKAVCPVNGHPLTLMTKAGVDLWVNIEPSGCLLEEDNLYRLKEAKEKFLGTRFQCTNFVPSSMRGLFDCQVLPSSGLIIVTVRMFCTFLEGEMPKGGVPKNLEEGYKSLKPWTTKEQLTWQMEAQKAVELWNGKFRFKLDKGGWKPLFLTPLFQLKFVDSKNEAQIVANVTKIPPVDPNFFNCGGTFVGLDQIFSGNPLQASKAALTSESGKPVVLNSQNLGVKEVRIINYNVMAHEFGHMIGLPDEYENPTSTGSGKKEDQAKVLHKNGSQSLAVKARVGCPAFGEYTGSIMSRGDAFTKFHFITVWEALVAMTASFSRPEEWDIVL